MGVCCSKHSKVSDHDGHHRAMTGTTAEALTTAGVTISLAAGAGLLEVASQVPFVAPIAFLVGSIILGCQEAESLRSDCKEFSLVAQEVERVLIKASDLSKEKETVESIRDVLEEGMAFVRTLNKTNVVMQVIGSKHNANELKSCRDRLVSLIQSLTFSSVVDLNVMNSCKFEEEKKLDALIQSMGGAEAVVNDDEKSKDVAEAMYNGVEALNLLLHKQTHKNQDDQNSKLDSQSSKLDSQSSKLDEHKCALENMQKALDEQRQLSLHNKEHAEVMARQNEILMKQVQQMNVMMMQNQMQMSEFMTRFPLRHNEAQVQIAIEKLGIEYMQKPVDALEDLLDEFIMFPNEPGLELVSIAVDIIAADILTVAATRTFNDVDQEWVGRRLKSEAAPMMGDQFSKKMTMCQYTVAEDRVCCFRGKDRDTVPELKISNSAFMESIVPTLSQADPMVGKSFEETMGSEVFGVAMKAVSGEITFEKGREVAVRMGTSLREYKHIEQFARNMTLLECDDSMYLGAPWRIQGKTIGVCCCMIKAKPEHQLSNEEMTKKLGLDRLAEMVAASVEDFVRSPIHRARVDPTYTTTLWQKGGEMQPLLA